MSRNGSGRTTPSRTMRTIPRCSTTNRRSVSPGGAVTSTGRSKLPTRVSETTSDVSTGGAGGGGGGGLTETPIAPFIPSRACPGTEHRKRNVPLRGKRHRDRLALPRTENPRALPLRDDEVVDGAPAVAHDEAHGRAGRDASSRQREGVVARVDGDRDRASRGGRRCAGERDGTEDGHRQRRRVLSRAARRLPLAGG